MLLFFKQKSFNESKDNSQIGQILKKFLAQYGENKTAEQQKEITKIIIMSDHHLLQCMCDEMQESIRSAR